MTSRRLPPAARAPVLLVTGFGPFPRVADNPSGRVAMTVDGTTRFGVHFVGRVVPVHWADAWTHIAGHINAIRPDGVVMLGVGRRTRVEIERIARNRAGGSVDAAGLTSSSPLIDPDGPAELETRLPWRSLLAAGVGLSTDAGDYLCNYVFYRAMRALRDHTAICGFVHLPPRLTGAEQRLLDRMARWLHRQGSATPICLDPRMAPS
ncbi:MAG: hypothetical protein KC620_02080 [Myxococcales bacterium]|nr:hypothetical protein [Myxococcales bacterium]